MLLFGVGMIGSAIRDSLQQKGYQVTSKVPVDWSDGESRNRGFEEIKRACIAFEPVRLCIAWSAGKSNFYSSERDVEEESRSFEAVLELERALRTSLANTRFEFHLLSSAGGLFEGQLIVNQESTAAPRRPYGRMKLEQERRLLAITARQASVIYRPSSVYGPMVRLRKHGLINHLVANASNRRTSVLDANVMALRDYVYSGDIGEYVARQIAFAGSGLDGTPVHFLVSGRCASIFEVVSRIERVLKIKVRYRFDANFGNSANITFGPAVLPRNWRPSSLDVGIRQFILKDRPQSRSIESTSGRMH